MKMASSRSSGGSGGFGASKTRVGRYELGKTLGEGTFAKVKFARNIETGENVAIKILDKEKILKHKMIGQIKREISTMKLIRHPNVIRMFEEDGLLHTTCGTPNYVAPEVINNKGYDGAKADLWSCGVILFVLMAGYLPFEESNLLSLYKKIFKAEFTCPPWFSSSAKRLVKRILDPNPQTRITIAELIENDWFKKGYQPPVFQQEEVSLDDVDSVFDESAESQNLVVERREEHPTTPLTMNAFELISTSQGLNLSSLFEKHMGFVKRETRFTSKRPANEIISKIEEAAVPLGFGVKKNNYKMKLQAEKTGRKGHLSVATEIYEVAPSLFMVELRKAGGDTLEFHKFYKNLSTGLKDIVWKTGDEAKEELNDACSLIPRGCWHLSVVIILTSEGPFKVIFVGIARSFRWLFIFY
ncbi:CBL-interacting serine/threonine-protein kinase 23-like isoform X11 [Coffea arabica]|uniref:non-specific serine/threonine protein kinase n=1 Tax=Coffea arabica TaxID=13443 RepID=A0ABM4VLZ0_COFAR